MDVADLEALVARARDAFNEGRPGVSGRLYQEVLDAVEATTSTDEHESLHVRAVLGVATTRFEADGDLDAALATMSRAWSLAESCSGADLRGVVLGQRARVLLLSGRVDEALATFEEAEVHLATTAAIERATLLLNRGVLHMDLGSLGSATRDLARAEAEAVAHGLDRVAYKARHNLGWVRFLEGDLPGAMAAMATAPQREGTEPLAEDPIAHVDRARVLLEAGLADRADEMLARAAATFARTGRVQDQAEALLGRAHAALLDRDAEAAHRHARVAAAAFAARGNDRWEHRARATALDAELLDLRGDDTGSAPSGAPGELRQLAADARALALAAAADADLAARVLLVAVEAALAVGDVDRAASLLAGVELPVRASMALRLRWHRARAGVARVTDRGAALRVVVDGVDELSEAQAGVGSLDLRTAMAVHGRGLVQVGIRAALEGGDPEQVHWAFEAAHASSTRITTVRGRHTGEDRELLGRLRRAEEALWRADLHPDARRFLHQTVKDLHDRLSRRDWRRAGGRVTSRTSVVDLPTLRTCVARHDAVAVTFVVDRGRWWAARVDGAGVDVIDLGPGKPLAAALLRLRADLRARLMTSVGGPMAAAVDASLQRSAADVDRRVLAPLSVGGRRLVVVPHGDLGLVPWGLLPSRRGDPTIVTTCATRWVAAEGRTDPPGPGGDAPIVRSFAGPRLARSGQEAAAVAGQWSAGVSRTSDVRRAEVAVALARADIVHLAAHGTHRRRSPLFSSILLADGPLYAHELDLSSTRLVVLSACSVGEHHVRPGDEPLGLSAALLATGVGTVIASIGRVEDDVAAELMPDVHAGLATGRSPAAAVAAATDAATERGVVAPFVVLGGGLAAVA